MNKQAIYDLCALRPDVLSDHPDDAVKPAADDFNALKKLRRIVYGEEIGAPKQLSLYEQLEVAK